MVTTCSDTRFAVLQDVGIFYQELKEITIFNVVSYPIVIRGIIMFHKRFPLCAR